MRSRNDVYRKMYLLTLQISSGDTDKSSTRTIESKSTRRTPELFNENGVNNSVFINQFTFVFSFLDVIFSAPLPDFENHAFRRLVLQHSAFHLYSAEFQSRRKEKRNVFECLFQILIDKNRDRHDD
jgi:hypothetical protein